MDPYWLTSEKPGDQGPLCFYFLLLLETYASEWNPASQFELFDNIFSFIVP